MRLPHFPNPSRLKRPIHLEAARPVSLVCRFPCWTPIPFQIHPRVTDEAEPCKQLESPTHEDIVRMKPQPSVGPIHTDPMTAPESVRVLRTLGQGRAARAQLVEAVFRDGRSVRCVEKVFAPGLLTRTLYRLSFQSPFAYQSNRDAILACFYRRRVAEAAIAGSDISASVASPLYVRYDQATDAWVLAAEWIVGRGIKPADADPLRIRRRLSNTAGEAAHEEIDELVDTMSRLEKMLSQCGLVGSGWQVDPRALVSTANLLRVNNEYTIIDLESGIPAVLVPRYLIAGLLGGNLPPFDDLDANQLESWLVENERLLTFRIGPQAVEQLRADSAKLIEHSNRWKESELALFRRPWRLFSKRGSQAYQRECYRRWQQDGIVDSETARSLPSRPIKARMIWYAGLLPSSLGRLCSRLIGHRVYRQKAFEFLRNRESRHTYWQSLVRDRRSRWIASERIPETAKLTTAGVIFNSLMQKTTPKGLQRFVTDANHRRELATSLILLVFSSRYQSWFGHRRIDASIDRWNQAERITDEEAAHLRRDLSGKEVRAYTRGFGMHLALKALAPFLLPAKVGGVAAFLAGGSIWFLLPMLATPVLRTSVTLVSWWTTRHEHIPHSEALATGWLPFVGSVAFPLQMFASRPALSTFLIRDTASKLGRTLPVYGGADSRTEITFIRATDSLVELMHVLSSVTRRLLRAADTEKSSGGPQTLKMQPRSRFGRWLDRKAVAKIAAADQPRPVEATGLRDASAA